MYKFRLLSGKHSEYKKRYYPGDIYLSEKRVDKKDNRFLFLDEIKVDEKELVKTIKEKTTKTVKK